MHLRRKIFPSKLRSTPKREIFLQDKIKNHGKADACRGFLMQYCGKRSVWERINPYVRPPFRCPLRLSVIFLIQPPDRPAAYGGGGVIRKKSAKGGMPPGGDSEHEKEAPRGKEGDDNCRKDLTEWGPGYTAHKPLSGNRGQ